MHVQQPLPSGLEEGDQLPRGGEEDPGQRHGARQLRQADSAQRPQQHRWVKGSSVCAPSFMSSGTQMFLDFEGFGGKYDINPIIPNIWLLGQRDIVCGVKAGDWKVWVSVSN